MSNKEIVGWSVKSTCSVGCNLSLTSRVSPYHSSSSSSTGSSSASATYGDKNSAIKLATNDAYDAASNLAYELALNYGLNALGLDNTSIESGELDIKSNLTSDSVETYKPIYSYVPKYLDSYNTFISNSSTSGSIVKITELVGVNDPSIVIKFDGLGGVDNGTVEGGVQSECHGLLMISAALYNDKTTFDKCLNLVQAGIQMAELDGANFNRLFSWVWAPVSEGVYIFYNIYGYYDTASNGDCYIAQSLIFASIAWDTVEDTKYGDLAKLYISGIRSFDIDPTLYLVQNGTNDGLTNYHPDYFNPRTCQLFEKYDTDAPSGFWNQVITNSTTIYKAILKFGDASVDNRTQYTPTTDSYYLIPGTFNTSLSNPFYENVTDNKFETLASGDYEHVILQRSQSYENANEYSPDAQRITANLAFYFNQPDLDKINPDLVGIGNSMLYALNTTYLNTNYSQMYCAMSIYDPWTQDPTVDPNSLKSITIAGLFALSNNNKLKIGYTYDVLDKQFGNGIDGVISLEDNTNSAYDYVFAMWNLVNSYGGSTPVLDMLNMKNM
jgi:hypothetical protein